MQCVIARDDTSTTGCKQWAGHSHSAPWFGQWSDLEEWGSPSGFGRPWRGDAVGANLPSDPFLITGFDRQLLHLKNAALWFGNVDDLWRIGLPSGVGEPWKNTKVLANTPSDPYLMLGYDHKLLELSHESHEPVTFRIEVYVAADDSWSGSIHTSFLSKGLRTPPPE